MWSWAAVNTHRSIALAMKSQVSYLCLALTAIVAIVATVLATPDSCSTQYQEALRQVMDLRNSCPHAVMKDCCEVRDSTNTHIDTYL